jgi:hypothetical protein
MWGNESEYSFLFVFSKTNVKRIGWAELFRETKEETIILRGKRGFRGQALMSGGRELFPGKGPERAGSMEDTIP